MSIPAGQPTPFVVSGQGPHIDGQIVLEETLNDAGEHTGYICCSPVTIRAALDNPDIDTSEFESKYPKAVEMIRGGW